jgi:hypothetical protein
MPMVAIPAIMALRDEDRKTLPAASRRRNR